MSPPDDSSNKFVREALLALDLTGGEDRLAHMLSTRHSIFIIRMAVARAILVNGQGPISAKFLIQKTAPRLRQAPRRHRGDIDLRPALAAHFHFWDIEFCG